MKFEIKKNFSGEVQLTAEIDADENAPLSVKIGLAVKWAYESDADLRGADLRDADLRGAELRDADLRDADLRDADLRDADLRYAYLRGVDLRGAYLRGADLRGADLRDADLRGADLRGAELRDAKNIGDFTMPDGLKFSEYLSTVVPALLTAGGKSLEQIVACGAWECHSWDSCPMAVAFNVHAVEDVPPLYRARAREFVQFFDSGLIPCPITKTEDAA